MPCKGHSNSWNSPQQREKQSVISSFCLIGLYLPQAMGQVTSPTADSDLRDHFSHRGPPKLTISWKFWRIGASFKGRDKETGSEDKGNEGNPKDIWHVNAGIEREKREKVTARGCNSGASRLCSLGQIGPLPVFVMFHWKTAMLHSLSYCLWLLSWYNGRDEWLWQRPCGQEKLEYSSLSHLQKKFVHSWPCCSPMGGSTYGCSLLLTRVLSLVYDPEPWQAMRNAREITNTF